ncbi:MAG: 3-deoxy-7-phosphoheptulonate synthase [Elusimicrobia bacterium]|nr:MAG: 3-deoxy-7-phosphoheptulonate synthase [Elusimicrobiota bacterium]KAF0156757.1 MAG: 3-deoxy-7-phosphoheptulonate synthase [Elusimicrobiota bacterium]
MKILLEKKLSTSGARNLAAALARLLPGAAQRTAGRSILVTSPRPEIFSEKLALIENLPGAAAVLLSDAEACPLAAKAPPPELPFKDGFIIIAGPCAVEDAASYARTARALARAGATGLRAALFKPRSSPYAFQGLGLAALPAVRRAARAAGLPPVTEIVDCPQAARLASAGFVLQIGARNMRNYELLKAAGRTGAPVILKRAPGASLREWLLSAEYLLKYGESRVILCERGDSFGDGRLNLKTMELAMKATALPVIADPSHACGRRELVAEQALAAARAGADGLMIEAAPDPASVLVDGRQTLDLPCFLALSRKIRALRK